MTFFQQYIEDKNFVNPRLTNHLSKILNLARAEKKILAMIWVNRSSTWVDRSTGAKI
jgi:hypothetical protein